MILIPKFNHLYIVQEVTVPINEIKLRIDLRHITDQKIPPMEISFDGKKYEEFIPGMKIPTKYHKTKAINMKLRIRKDGKWKEYIADELVTTAVTLLGRSIEEIYPEVINQLFTVNKEQAEEIKLLKESVRKLADIVLEVHQKGDIGGLF